MTAPPITDALRRRTLVLLFGVSFLNYLDRNVIGILVPAIKADLTLSDTEIGFITGIAFSLFYAVMGIPIARLADRFPRRMVIAGAMTLWSLMTAACGLAANFWQLALARVLVGVGGGGATPPSHSLIADLFPKERRATALSLYAIGSAVGLVVGFLIGGWITQAVGWRAALLGVGLPGVLVAVAVMKGLPEPPRGYADGHAPVPPPPLGATLRTVLSRPTFVHNAIASGLYAAMYFGLLAWVPSFFSRTYHLAIGEIGTWLAAVMGVSQFLGTVMGGVVGDRLARRDQRWLMWFCGAVTVMAVPFYPLVFMSDAPPYVALVLLAPPFFLGVSQGGPQHATTQGVAPPAMRATASATYLLIVSLIAGLGAQTVGLLSDALAPCFGDGALGTAITIVTVGASLWAGVHFWYAARNLPRDYGRPA
jgi:predicted MFS family arabinose efflux permease